VHDKPLPTGSKRHATIAARQHGLIRTRQLGLTTGAIAKRVKAGTLHRKYRGVHAYGHAKLSQKGEWLAAVFAAGDDAGLGGLSAATFYAISRFKEPYIEVVAPKQRRPQAGFRLRFSRTLLPRDIVVRDHIPVTTVARTLLDASDLLLAEQVANLIHEAAYRRLFNLAATRDVIARNPGARAKVLKRAIELHLAGSAGTRSHLEDRFLALVRRAGLPEPVINTPHLDIEVDFRWGTVCVEVDGPNHERPGTRADDRAKQAFLESRGFTVVRFTHVQIDHRPAEVVQALAVALPASIRPLPY
jgi:Protein of unknown function (DUF559)